MNKLKMLWNSIPLTYRVASLVLVVILLMTSFFTVYQKVQSYAANARIERLEAANKEANDKVLILEGKIQSLYTTLDGLNSKIAEADANTQLADKETTNAKKHYNEIRSGGPRFVDPSTNGKVAELTELLNILYP